MRTVSDTDHRELGIHDGPIHTLIQLIQSDPIQSDPIQSNPIQSNRAYLRCVRLPLPSSMIHCCTTWYGLSSA